MLAMRVLAEGGEGGPNVVMWVLVFLAIFALMVLIGWWASASGKVKQEEELVHSDHGHDSHAAHDTLPAASSQWRLCTSFRLKTLRPRLSALKSMPTWR